MGIRAANREYERWLEGQLRGDIVEADLKQKAEKNARQRLRLPARHLLALG